MTAESVLSLRGVRKRFGRHEALRGLDLDVPRGSILGLIGPNGAGKTTTFSIACGFLRPDAGTLSILGLPAFDARRLRGRLGAMPQDAAMGRETRCDEQLRYFGALQGLGGKELDREIGRVLGEVGLAERRRDKTKTLSHGMLRRLAIAQALLGHPELVLLDEPTSGLDPRHAHELRELLRKLRAEGGRTLVISSHNLPELESLCDHVAFVDQGKVVAAGPTAELTGRGHEIEIQLGEGPVPLDALKAALPDDAVEWEPEGRQLRIRFTPRDDRAAEDVIGVALAALLAQSARISGVRRGQSLERKFLAMT